MSLYKISHLNYQKVALMQEDMALKKHYRKELMAKHTSCLAWIVRMIRKVH